MYRSIQVAQWNACSLHHFEQDRRLVEFRELAEDNQYNILCLSETSYSIINIPGFCRVGFSYGNGEVGTTVLIRKGMAFKRDKRLSNLFSNLPCFKAAAVNISGLQSSLSSYLLSMFTRPGPRQHT
jgi:hypothetical protein